MVLWQVHDRVYVSFVVKEIVSVKEKATKMK